MRNYDAIQVINPQIFTGSGVKSADPPISWYYKILRIGALGRMCPWIWIYIVCVCIVLKKEILH